MPPSVQIRQGTSTASSKRNCLCELVECSHSTLWEARAGVKPFVHLPALEPMLHTFTPVMHMRLKFKAKSDDKTAVIKQTSRFTLEASWKDASVKSHSVGRQYLTSGHKREARLPGVIQLPEERVWYLDSGQAEKTRCLHLSWRTGRCLCEPGECPRAGRPLAWL
jgi:hypothetical protein